MTNKTNKKAMTIARRFGLQNASVFHSDAHTIRVVGTGDFRKVAKRMGKAYGIVSYARQGIMGWLVMRGPVTMGRTQLYYDKQGRMGLEFVAGESHVAKADQTQINALRTEISEGAKLQIWHAAKAKRMLAWIRNNTQEALDFLRGGMNTTQAVDLIATIA